uniref:ribose-5-phosphate isomerase n=1 Tax=Syphacia muris TaxID=451379 RepID=A0A0N5AK13_9BILA
MSSFELAKRSAAFAAGEAYIRSGCRLGVGTGTTVKYVVDYLEEKIKEGKLSDIVCVPSSHMTRLLLLKAGIRIATFDETPELDVYIDGADEIDSNLNCIKGGCGCLVRERIVQSSSKHFVLIADNSKQSKYLGEQCETIPIEVVPFGYVPAINHIMKQEGGHCSLRASDVKSAEKIGPVITDNNNYLLDWNFPKDQFRTTEDLLMLKKRLNDIPGVVDSGIFANVAEKAYIGSPEGSVLEIFSSNF